MGVAYRCEFPASSTLTLAVEWRDENGVERLENRLGKPLKDMTRALVLNVISIVKSGVSGGLP